MDRQEEEEEAQVRSPVLPHQHPSDASFPMLIVPYAMQYADHDTRLLLLALLCNYSINMILATTVTISTLFE